MTYPDRVSVFHKLSALPHSSHDCFQLEVIMLSERHRRTVARCLEDIVMYDYRTGGKVTFEATPFILDAFRDTFKAQEEAATLYHARARDIDRRVLALEHASWDREGAVEDFGTTTP